MNRLCPRHEAALETAVDLRGLEHGLPLPAFDALIFARQAIVLHATNFSGRAAIELLAKGCCAICFVNDAIARVGKNPGLRVDDWVERAADEALEEDTRRRDGVPRPRILTA